MTITFKRKWFFGGDYKDGSDDWVCGYEASNGKYIENHSSFCNDNVRWYVVDGKSFDTLKEAKAYVSGII